MTGKGMLLEEPTRVPLIISVPQLDTAKQVQGDIAQPVERAVVTTPVSQLDLFSTILDYLNAPALDKSDGTSLRRFIENQSFNQHYDEAIVVVEQESRFPTSATTLSGKFGDSPSIMIRKGSFKLIIPRDAKSKVIDMMYNLDQDP